MGYVPESMSCCCKVSAITVVSVWTSSVLPVPSGDLCGTLEFCECVLDKSAAVEFRRLRRGGMIALRVGMLLDEASYCFTRSVHRRVPFRNKQRVVRSYVERKKTGAPFPTAHFLFSPISCTHDTRLCRRICVSAGARSTVHTWIRPRAYSVIAEECE